MAKKLIIFNGPTGIGKTRTIDKAHIALKNTDERIRVKRLNMSTALKEGLHKTFNLAYGPDYYDRGAERAKKDEVHPLLLGRTLREGYINFSKGMKYAFGANVFGSIYANYVHNNLYDVFLADGGIHTEWYPVIDYMGADNVIVIELTGIDFEPDDYREYIGEKLQEVYPNLTLKRLDTKMLTSDDEDERMLYNMMVEKAVNTFVGS